MKNLLILCIAILIIAPCAYLAHRYQSNTITNIPYPFVFSPLIEPASTDAQVVIIGDKMADRLAKFSKELSRKISGKGMTKTIKITSLAKENQNIHRSLHKIKTMGQLPLIIIFMSNIDDSSEKLFYKKDIKNILENFKYYSDPWIQSIIMAMPLTSRFIYNPITKKKLDNSVELEDITISDIELQKKMQLKFMLYEASLKDLIEYTQDNNSILIPVTSPLNLLTKPIKPCYGSLDPSTKPDIEKIKKLIKGKNFKEALNLSQEVALINSSHSVSLFLHGYTSLKANKYQDAQNYLEKAIAFDCTTQRGSPVYNNIMKMNAKNYGVKYIDYHKYLVDQSYTNYTFIDDTFPQDFYMEKLTDMLALRIRNLLKL